MAFPISPTSYLLTGNCQPSSASLSASYSSPQNKGANNGPCAGTGYVWWEFNTYLKEISGNAGITVNQREKCIRSGSWSFGCGEIKTDIVSKFDGNYIPKSGQISWINNYVCLTSGFAYTIKETFWGTDDNANAVQDSHTIYYDIEK